MIKLLLVTHYYPKHRGGVEIVAGKIIEKLTQNNPILATWIASNTDACPIESQTLRCLPVSTINIFEQSLHIPYPIWTFSALKTLLNEIKVSDIIHLHDYLYMGNLFTFILGKIYKKPIIITQHIGLVPYKNFILRWLLSLLNRTIGAYILSSVDQVIFISEEVRKYFLSFKSFKCHPLLIANGVEVDIFRPILKNARISIRQDFGFSDKDTIFLFVGRFVEKKGLEVLKELAKLFPQVCWCFVGWGPMDPSEWKLLNVSVFKKLDNSQLPPIYQMADLLVLPSKGEGFPLVVQESMACGTPVMVSSEVAQSYPNGDALMFSAEVETPSVVDRWVEKLNFLLSNPDLISDFRPKVSDFAAHHWNWDNCIKNYTKTINLLLHQQMNEPNKNRWV